MCGIAIFRQLPQLESETSVVMSARKIAAALISAPMMTAWSIAAITPRGKSVWTCVAVYAHGRNLSFPILCFLRPFARSITQLAITLWSDINLRNQALSLLESVNRFEGTDLEDVVHILKNVDPADGSANKSADNLLSRIAPHSSGMSEKQRIQSE